MAKKPAARKNVFRAAKEVRKLARERLGAVPPGHIIPPKSRRKAPKHRKQEQETWLED